MPDIVLYDRVGAPVTYPGADSITVDTPTAGETAKFTYGELAEGVEVEPDFSGGDHKISVPEGYLVREATIKKPDDLDPAIIAHGEYVAGVGPGTYVGKGAEKTVELDFKDYPEVDTPEAIAAILTDGNNFGKVYRFTGESGDYTNGQFYKVVNGYEAFDPQSCSEVAVEVASGTELTATINCNVGDLIVAAFAIRSVLVSLSDGWKLISTSKSVNEINSTAGTYYQTLSFAYKYAKTTTESITVAQETAGRIYINMVSIVGATGIVDMGFQYQNNESAISANVATFTRPEGKVVLWGVTCYLWGTATPYREWSLSNDSVKIQLGTSTQSRLLLAIDTSNDATVTFTSGSTATSLRDAIICGALSIEFTLYAFKPVDASEALLKDSVTVEPDPGTLMTQVTITKPETLISENIRNGVEVNGVPGAFIGDTEEAVVDPNFTDGTNMVVTPSAVGKVLSKVTITKPDTLIPENIAIGVNIAGIIGAGASVKCGEFTTPSSTSPGIRISVDIGFVPDILLVWAKAYSGMTTSAFTYWGISDTFSTACGASGLNTYNYGGYGNTYGTSITAAVNSNLPITGADETGFNLGMYAPCKSWTYCYVAIGGLT